MTCGDVIPRELVKVEVVRERVRRGEIVAELVLHQVTIRGR